MLLPRGKEEGQKCTSKVTSWASHQPFLILMGEYNMPYIPYKKFQIRNLDQTEASNASEKKKMGAFKIIYTLGVV